MYINRFLEKDLKKYLNKKEIVAVIGARQCGKTTLLKHIFKNLKNALFLDFEDRETLELFNHDIKSFIDLYVKKYNYLFIDEFQYATKGGKNLKYIYDNYKTKLIISGSSASALSIQSIKHLVGRIFVFNLYPFSFEEYLSYKEPAIYKDIYLKRKLTPQIIQKILPHFNEFCIFGGYPRIVLSKDKKEKQTVLRNIYNTYFLKEIKEILNLPDDYKLSKLIKALALQVGNIINYNELSDITGFKHNDLLEYMNILEKTFVCLRSTPYYTNKRTELVKAPKIFFLDNGFRNTVLKNFVPIKNRQDKGALYENFAASEIAKKGHELKYWRTKSKAEVDFVLEKESGIFPIEVKSGLKNPRFTKSFLSFLNKYKPEDALIVSEQISGRKNKVRFRPIFSISKQV
ncbi:MAG: ATP-binding protein [Nanoarchaeota archaeon]|nr:ATP-binding protein [Nanoarchaeota archaeon]MBU1322358.1 ATP-binding protein [Nanoarchaeota archaeon]MBU1596971.1 ATP-binding protein [Nanoarchaeota archaeon]MBU2441694.1 ATP-binding protein [Nanoarchaeota archaeon]